MLETARIRYVVIAAVAAMLALFALLSAGGLGAQSDEGDACMRWLAGSAEGDDAIVGEWDADCLSAKAAPGKPGERHARFYAFALTEDATVTVTLTSKDDTYLYLLSGAGRDGDALAENDDIDRDARNYNSRLEAPLSAGTYTIEATTYHGGVDGEFTLEVVFDPEGAVVVPTATPLPTDDPDDSDDTDDERDACLQWLGGSVEGDDAIAGEWDADCLSEREAPGAEGERRAHFYAFILEEHATITVTLTSETDTYLYLLSSAGRVGEVEAENDDIDLRAGNYNSRLEAALSAGTYTIEATTYDGGADGEFTLEVGFDPEVAVSDPPPTTPTPEPTPTPPPATAPPAPGTTPEPTPTHAPESTPEPTATPAPGTTPEPEPTPTPQRVAITATDVDGYYSEYRVEIFVSSIGTNLTMGRTNTYTSNRNYVKLRSDGTLITGIGGTPLTDRYYWTCNPFNGSTGEGRHYATDTHSLGLPKTDLSNDPLLRSSLGRRVLRMCNGDEEVPTRSIRSEWAEHNRFDGWPPPATRTPLPATATPVPGTTPDPEPTPTPQRKTITATDVDGYYSEYEVEVFVSSIGTNLTMTRTNTYTSNRAYVKLRPDGTLITGIGGTPLTDRYYWTCNPFNGSTGEGRHYATDTHSLGLPKTDLSNDPLLRSSLGRRVLRMCNGDEEVPTRTVRSGWAEHNSFDGWPPAATPTPLPATATPVPGTTPEPEPTPTPQRKTITATDVDGYYSEYRVEIFVSSIGTNLTMGRTNTYTSNRAYVKLRPDGTLITGIGGTPVTDRYYWTCNPFNGSTGEGRHYATDTHSLGLPKTDLSNDPLLRSSLGRRVLRMCNGDEEVPTRSVRSGWAEHNRFDGWPPPATATPPGTTATPAPTPPPPATATPLPAPVTMPTPQRVTITAADVDGYYSEYRVEIFVSSIGTNLTMGRTNTYTSNRKYVKLRSDGTLITGIGGTPVTDRYYWTCNPFNGSTGEGRHYATDTHSLGLPKTDLSNDPLLRSSLGRRVLRMCNGDEEVPTRTVRSEWAEHNRF